jgi:hypothetical protein
VLKRSLGVILATADRAGWHGFPVRFSLPQGVSMPFAIRYGVPYKVVLAAQDVGSGKKISNTLYYYCGIQSVAPPAYGQPIAGASNVQTFANNVGSLWITAIMARMNANYQLLSSYASALIGKRYGTPSIPILALIAGSPATIATAAPHGLVTGQVVSIGGVTLPAGANGLWTITVTTPTQFTLNGSVLGIGWTGDGYVQVATGQLEFLTTDLDGVTFSPTFGSIVGDALPLYATSSVRRINGGIGRHFRSRFSLSPMSEIDNLDGGFTTTQKGLMVTALTAMMATVQNGGSDATSKFMGLIVVSKRLAFALPSPFSQSLSWTAIVTSMVQQRNLGSLVKRKPRLTSIIV